MKKYGIFIVILILAMLGASDLFAKTKFRGIVSALNVEKQLVVVNYYGNPDLRVGAALYVHDIYAQLKAEMTVVDIQADTIVATVDKNQFGSIRCGNFVADFPPSKTTNGQLTARYDYNVKVKYQKADQNFYDVMIDKMFEFDNYISFIGDTGKQYKIDFLSLKEVGIKVEGERLFITHFLIKDEEATEDEKLVFVSTAEKDAMGWERDLLKRLRAIEVYIDERFLYTWKDIVSVKMDKQLTPIATSKFIEKYLITQETINLNKEDSVNALKDGESALQTDQLIKSYPTVFRFDQFKHVIPTLQEKVNTLVNSELPDVEEIVRLTDLIKNLSNMDEKQIVRVWLVMDEPSQFAPVELDKKEGFWEAVVNLTVGIYKYHYNVEVLAEPCNETVSIKDPLNPESSIEVIGKVIPVEIKEAETNGNGEGEPSKAVEKTKAPTGEVKPTDKSKPAAGEGVKPTEKPSTPTTNPDEK